MKTHERGVTDQSRQARSRPGGPSSRRARWAAGSRLRTSPTGAIADLQRSRGNSYVERLLAGMTVQRCGRPGCPCHDASAVAQAAVQRKASGSPLPATVRSAMESSLGEDFGGVRVHTDSEAAGWARQMGARAFTTGRNVFFAAGEYEPGSQRGQGLIAHELTHVVQQRQGRAAAAAIDTPGDVYEREADAVAQAVMRGEPIRLRPRPFPPTMQRANGNIPPPAPPGIPATPAGGTPSAAVPPVPAKGPTILGDIVRLPLPGPNPLLYALEIPGGKVTDPTDQASIQKRYREVAEAGALRTTHAGRGGTSTLWNMWASARGITAPKDSDTLPVSSASGSAPSPGTLPVRTACSPDHIIELQIGGADRGENLRLLRQPRNEAAGSALARRIAAIRKTVNQVLAQQQPGFPGQQPDPVLEFRQDLISVGNPEGPDECLTWDTSVTAAGVQGTRAGGAAAAFVGGQQVTIGYTPANSNVDAHSRYVVPGFRLQQVPKQTAPYEMTGRISDRARIPFLTPADVSRQYTFDVPAPPQPTTIRGAGAVYLAFPFLSEAALPIRLEEGELRASGTFRPTLPILRNVDVNLEIAHEQLTGGVSVPPDKLKQALPVPGLDVTDANLQLRFADGRFTATGGFAVRYGTVADGRVEARFAGGQFSATGTIMLHIPGIDEAKGEIWVREGRLGGRITIGADKLRFPGVRSANLVVTIQDGALTGEGRLDLAIPGIRQALLGFGIDKDGNYAITGTAVLSIPGVRDATAELAYRDGDLQGRANVGLDIPGLEGAGAALEVLYAHGALTGRGTFNYRKGRLSGTVSVVLSERHRLSGGGELAYEIAPGLVAFAGLQIGEDGRTRISGGLRVPETIDLFGRSQIEKELFRLPTIEIPIIAIPLGTRSAGLVATIGARMVARAGVGPGQLRHVRLLAEFDPSKDESAFSFQAAAELFVPANAELALAISGGIGLSLAIARAVGGIEAEAAAGLQAEFIAAADLRYQNGQFAVQGKAELSAQPRLVFRLRAFVRVELDLVVTTIEVYSKEWLLAQVEAGSALKVGVRIPFTYVFGQPFHLALDDVEFMVPDVNLMDLAHSLLPG